MIEVERLVVRLVGDARSFVRMTKQAERSAKSASSL